MENFSDMIFYVNDQNYIKQTIFSLGMTLISAIYLEDITDKVYNPLHLNKKMKVDFSFLNNLV